jgi:bifunctional non-homologous end joining protein LigD
LRKANLARLLARRPDGIFLSDFEQGEIGPDFWTACVKRGADVRPDFAWDKTGAMTMGY